MKRPLSTDDPCSREAADRVKPYVEPIKEQVLKYVREHPGVSCEDVSIALRLKHQTASARFNDLVAENKLEFDLVKGADGRTLRRYRIVQDPRQVRLF